ncbi:MAG: hypothetical protein V4481_01540 [Patescibacteria group bacterium]
MKTFFVTGRHQAERGYNPRYRVTSALVVAEDRDGVKTFLRTRQELRHTALNYDQDPEIVILPELKTTATTPALIHVSDRYFNHA